MIATNPPEAEQNAETTAVDSAVVREDLKVGGAGLRDGLDKLVRYAAQPKSTDGQGRPVGDVGNRSGNLPEDFVHVSVIFEGTCEALGKREVEWMVGGVDGDADLITGENPVTY